jgi:hypothetical protein
MVKVKAKCIKETYTWSGDGEQHHFPYVKLGFVYVFNKEEQFEPYRRTVYWLDKTQLPNPQDYEYIDYCSRGLETKEFMEMFELI